MGSVSALEEHVEQARAGEMSLKPVAYRYVGPRSNIHTEGALQQQGRVPKTAVLNEGTWYISLVPDEGLAYLENRTDMEVVYADDAERFAGILLDQNRLPGNAFGRGADPEIRDRIYDDMGLEDGVPAEEQLRELAGASGDGGDEPDRSRAQRIAGENTYDELKAMVKDLREDADEFKLTGKGKTDMAEFAAQFDEEEVASAGGDD